MRAILVSVARLVTVTSLSAQATQEQVTFTKNVASILSGALPGLPSAGYICPDVVGDL
jgi:hypothetical protein